MERIKLDIDTIHQLDLDKLSSKWSPLIESHFNTIRNRHFYKMVCICCEHILASPLGFITELNFLMENESLVMEGEEVCNLVTGNKEFLLENGKFLSYYTNSMKGGIEIFRYYIDCDDIVMNYAPYFIIEERNENIENLLEN